MLKYQLVVKGNGAGVPAKLRSLSKRDMPGAKCRVIATKDMSGQTAVTVEIDYENQVTVEGSLNRWFVSGAHSAPFPDGTLLYWAKKLS
jgi:hypothetical protein